MSFFSLIQLLLQKSSTFLCTQHYVLSLPYFFSQTKYAPKLKKQRRQKNTKPKPKYSSIQAKSKKKKAWGLLCIGQLLLSLNVFWVLLIHLASLHWRKWVFPLLAGISHKQFLVRDGTLYPPTPFLSAEIVYGLNLCRYCMCYHSVWVHMCISPVWLGRYSFCSLHAPSIPGSQSSFSFLHANPWALRGESPIRVECSSLSLSPHYPVVGLSVNYHLLREASLMRTGVASDRGVIVILNCCHLERLDFWTLFLPVLLWCSWSFLSGNIH